jgi:ABC-2 type transport system ATP-binding protein
MGGAASGSRTTTTVTFQLPQGTDAASLPAELRVAEVDGSLQVDSAEPTHTLFLLTRWATERNVELQDLTVTRPSLEDVYLSLVRDLSTVEAR